MKRGKVANKIGASRFGSGEAFPELRTGNGFTTEAQRA
jgi:hypothetical protein